MMGANCSAVTIPIAVAELWVSCRTSQSWAVLCIHEPVSEII